MSEVSKENMSEVNRLKQPLQIITQKEEKPCPEAAHWKCSSGIEMCDVLSTTLTVYLLSYSTSR